MQNVFKLKYDLDLQFVIEFELRYTEEIKALAIRGSIIGKPSAQQQVVPKELIEKPGF